jgi:hypothetical protein|tara:strand:+ start:21900 stop:23951 length:2052 start_codon:yes stop_codon:yes gene_type:complete
MDLSFLHESDLILWVALLTGAVLFYYLSKILTGEKWYHLLLIERFVIFLILGIMLFNPILNLSGAKEKKLDWAIFVDNSASIKYHQTPSINSIQSGMQTFVNRLSENNISFKLYQFADEIQKVSTPKLDGNGVTTNLGIISEKIKKEENNLAGAVIISDGLITEGKDPVEVFQQFRIPVHTLGIGKDTELVDVAIQSIDVPTVVLKSDGINVNVTIQSVGEISDRLSVSLYNKRKLLGSKHIKLMGQGSKREVNFRFRLKEIGKQEFEVRVSSVEDEINIQNNRQNFNLLVLKDRYKVALLTGSPNKNTSVLKRVLKHNPRIELDHFIRITESRFRPSIKSFWQTPYELIIFDNYPIKPLSPNFIRILGKKILSHQAAVMLIGGPNQSGISLKGVTSVLGVVAQDSTFDSGPVFWDFTNEQLSNFDLPPLVLSLFLSGKEYSSDTLALTESGWPLWLRNQNENIRTMVWTSPEINTLYFNDQKLSRDGPFSIIWDQSISWLLKTGGEHENFFRLNKIRYQQGEMVQITGTQPFEQKPGETENIIISVTQGDEIIITRDISFNIEEQRWVGEFRAPGPGEYNYSIQFDSDQDPIQSNIFHVLESQIELNQVHLNKKMLSSLSDKANGRFFLWGARDSLFSKIKPKVRREFKAEIVKFTESRILLFILVLLLCMEWYIRRKRGLS